MLAAVCRCPNPAACQHDERYLAARHPDSTSSDRLPWANYSRQLCNYGDGYEGELSLFLQPLGHAVLPQQWHCPPCSITAVTCRLRDLKPCPGVLHMCNLLALCIALLGYILVCCRRFMRALSAQLWDDSSLQVQPLLGGSTDQQP